MRLISPKKVDGKREEALRLCLKSSRLQVGLDELMACVSEGMANVEEGVRIIDQGLPIPRLGAIDLVAEDVRGRLVFINFFQNLDPETLSASLLRSDWAADNLEMLGHFYSRDFPGEIRCWQMVEEVTPQAASLVSRMEEVPVEVFTCEGVDLGGDRWLVVRRLDVEKAICDALRGGAIAEERPPAGTRGSVMRNPRADGGSAGDGGRLHSVLTRDEIDDFFDKPTYLYDEEVTSRVADPSK